MFTKYNHSVRVSYVHKLHASCYTEHCAACSNQTQTARVYQNADSSPSKHETASGQILAFAGLHTGVCLHPPLPSIIFSPADQGTFSKTAGQSQAYYNTWNWERGTYDVNHLHILTCEVAVSRVGSVASCMLTAFLWVHERWINFKPAGLNGILKFWYTGEKLLLWVHFINYINVCSVTLVLTLSSIW